MTTHNAHRVAVVGAGVMGTNIATMILGHGVPVILTDLGDTVLDQARSSIYGMLRHARLLGAQPAGVPLGDLVTTTVPEEVAGVTAVIEAVTESTEVKAKVLGEYSGLVRPGTPIISNTSGIPVDEMANWVARPAELAGTHFMNPAYLIRMVEVVRGPRTGDETMAAITALLTALDRRPVVVGDSPGFVTSRLLHPMINDAARLVGGGTATAEAVDALMEGCLGHPTGPLRTADLIGLDNLADSLQAIYERTGDEGARPCDTLLAKVRDGDLGRKSGRGFYDYGRTKP
ncbi:3-hydroxyacyl-CoA dehydrogenase family protein [Saccharomonospora xinjiangensis]|uniref:3-hydroxyacyl-CoA dehydrogenase n=1 Tax=Saccharomonospora xinjiangensis XJ-54 TaxID=882086 RepID=I0UY43_9PSEU|nr:3-hydroxyacyl-CoA dehydrogenase family protein [Saccharomonospora xinjiangensis]EID52796.1 3-hydroxyacyl-CoA dehydrogenase [Saccharomonospora xinjiangensis XJ-54]